MDYVFYDFDCVYRILRDGSYDGFDFIAAPSRLSAL